MKEALKLALEALETELAVDMTNGAEVGEAAELMCEAITAIKQALADHTEDNLEMVAPVQQLSYKGPEELWLQLHGDCSDDELIEPIDYTDDSVTWCWHQIHDSDVRYVRADTIPRAQPAPVQEPVAFKIYLPKVPRQDVNHGMLPWVYDQDPSSGNVASMWVTPVQTLRSKS